MKIKVIRRFERFLAPEGCEEEVYDIYHGFTGPPTTWPFHTKWIIDEAGLSRKEALDYLGRLLLDLSAKVIIKC
jgi:hypothetical protein